MLDFEFVSYVAGLPASVRSNPGYTKAALRDAVTDLVPDRVRLDRRVVVYNAVAHRALGPIPEGESLLRFLNRHFAAQWCTYLSSA